MKRQVNFGTRISLLCTVLGVLVLAISVLPTDAQAQVPPNILQFIDLKCYGITGDLVTFPPTAPLRLDHLNPLLRPPVTGPEFVSTLDPQQLCVPVAKPGADPPADVLQFLQFIDLKCYGLPLGEPLNLNFRLDHLNPLFQRMMLPAEFVTVLDPVKLCVPVAKNNLVPPVGTPIRQFVENIDLKCYNIVGDPLNLTLPLRHLNPLFQGLAAPATAAETVFVGDPQQLCVPVAKDQQLPPTTVLPIIENIDLKCYAIEGPPLEILRLNHLNPVFQRRQVPSELLFALLPEQLCVPVKKSRPIP